MTFYLALASLFSVALCLDHGRHEAWKVEDTGAASSLEKSDLMREKLSLMRREFHKRTFVNEGFWQSDLVKKEKARSVRTMAVVKPLPSLKMQDGTWLTFASAIPVLFQDKANYFAFLVKYEQKLWDKVNQNTFTCSGPGFEGPLDRYGGEHELQGQKYIALLCRWPTPYTENDDCFDISLGESGHELGSIQVCHDQKLHMDNKYYKLAACVGPAWEEKEHSEANGFVMMPQWLEYNLLHGIEHFLFYTTSESEDRHYDILKPYLEKGIATRVHLHTNDTDFSREGDLQQLIANDCLYRMKHRTDWLIPTMDVDEYIRQPQGDYDFDSLIPEKLGLHVNGSMIHSLMFGRYTFRHPEDSKDFQLTSIYREKELAIAMPKFVVKPNLVYTLYTHWPTSWLGETYPLGLPADALVAHHYRTTDKDSTSEKDKALYKQHKVLWNQLESRFQLKWSSFVKKLESKRPRHLAASGFSVLEADKNVYDLNNREIEFRERSRSLTYPLVLLPPKSDPVQQY